MQRVEKCRMRIFERKGDRNEQDSRERKKDFSPLYR